MLGTRKEEIRKDNAKLKQVRVQNVIKQANKW